MTIKNTIILLLVSAIFALLGAYVSQYFFGLKPCILCIYQRIPFFAIIFICLFALFFRNRKLEKLIQQSAIFLSIILLLINACVALYHVGVEKKLFKITEKCVGNLNNFATIEELAVSLKSQDIVRCDEPKFFFLGLTMAAWNVIFCLSLAAFAIFLHKKRRRWAGFGG